MHNQFRFLALVGVMAAFAIVGTPAEAGETLNKIRKAGKVTVGTEAAFPPFEFVEKGKIVGYGSDILKHVVAGLGVELNQLDVPWQGILPGVLAGKFDFIATTVVIRLDRAKKFAFTMPIAEGGSSVLKRKGDDTIKSVDDLNGKVVGVLLGATGEKLMRAFDKRMKAQGKPGLKDLKLATSSPENYISLANGQIDAVVSLLPSLANLIKKRPGIYELVGPVVDKKTWLAWVTRPGDTDLRDYINSKIKELRDNGKLYELQQKWFGFKMEIPSSGYLPPGAL